MTRPERPRLGEIETISTRNLIADCALELIAAGDESEAGSKRIGVAQARQAMHAIAREVEAEHPDLAALLREKPLAPPNAPAAGRRETAVSPAGHPLPVARMNAIVPRDAVVAFVETIDEFTDLPLLVAAYNDLLAKFGLDGFAMVDPRPELQPANGTVWASTWDEARLRHWTERERLEANPAVRQLRVVGGPLRWSVAAAAAGDEGRRFFEEACGNSLTDGVVIPLQSRAGGFVFAATGGPHYDLDRSEELNLHLAAIYFHAKLERMRDSERGRGARTRLTPRERECLSWVAAGKTDWEIAQILTIGEQTVHEYVQNALIKLNVSTRAHAVATAIFSKDILF